MSGVTSVVSTAVTASAVGRQKIRTTIRQAAF
jgi:hypothetical protein